MEEIWLLKYKKIVKKFQEDQGMKLHKYFKFTILAVSLTLFASNIYAEIPYNWGYLKVGKSKFSKLKKDLSKYKIDLDLSNNALWKEARIPTKDGIFKNGIFGKFYSFELKFTSEDILCEAVVKYNDEEGKLFNLFKNKLDKTKSNKKAKSSGNYPKYSYIFRDYTIYIDRVSSYVVEVTIINEGMFYAQVKKNINAGTREAADFVKKIS